MTAVLALDPGTRQTAYVVLDGSGSVLEHGIEPNEDLVLRLPYIGGVLGTHLVIEQVQGMGMAVGKEVFTTVWWTGRFWERWVMSRHAVPEWVTRREVKQHLCGQDRAKDANVRQSLLDRYGPGRELAVGRKATPGPLYGIRRDEWAALAVGVVWLDRQRTAAAAD